MSRHPTSLAWFRFHSGDLSLGEWLVFELHALRCSPCRERLRAERRERPAVEQALDALRPVPGGRPWWKPLVWAPVATAAAGLIVVVLLPPKEHLRPKGGSTFEIYTAAQGGPTLLTGHCRPRDSFQARYSSERPYLIVVGVDPANRTRTLLPLDGAISARIGEGAQLAPNSWILDEQPGRERFVAFFSDEPIDAPRAHRASVAERPSLESAVAIVRECVKGAP